MMGLHVEALKSTGDCDRDSAMGISKDDANQGVMSPTQAATHGRDLLTLVLSLQLGIASCAWALRRKQSGPPTRSSTKSNGYLVASPSRAS